MMRGAPKRWLDDGSSGLSSERDVLRSGLNVEPPPGQKDAVWAAILAGLPPGGGGGSSGAGGKAVAAKGAGGAAKAASLAAGGVLKGMILGAGGAALLVGGYLAIAAVRAPAAKPASMAVGASADERPAFDSVPFPSLTVAVSAQNREAAREPDARSTNTGAAAHTGSASPIAAPDPAQRQSQILEASGALCDARATLRGGDGNGALAQLEAMRGKFPPELLGPEREVLTIQALARAGNREQARSRADAFLRAHPDTIYASRLEPFTR